MSNGTISTIPAVKAYLIDALQGRSALTNTLIGYGWPAGPEPEMLLLTDVPEWEQSAAVLRAGGQPRDETYLLTIAAICEHGDTEQQPMTERCFELMAEVEQYLRTDSELGGMVRKAEIGGPGQLDEYVTPTQGRRSVVTMHIKVSGRI